jgi:hypothetical protein
LPLNTGLVPGLAGSIVTGRAAEVLSVDTRQFPRYTPPPPGVASSTVSPGPAKDKARAREHRSGTTELAGQEVWLAGAPPAAKANKTVAADAEGTTTVWVVTVRARSDATVANDADSEPVMRCSL